MSRILISAGHTSTDPGAIFGDLREADYTRKIAQKVVQKLELANAEVQGVPLDLPLLQRIQWINNTNYSEDSGDICVEIHINDGRKSGIESWFKGEGENDSQKLSKVLVETISEITGYENQGYKSEFQHELGSLTFLNRTSPTTVILETLYLDNPKDIAELKNDDKIDSLAQAVATAILKYFGKDESGKELPEDQKPKYENLQKVPHPLRSKQLAPRMNMPQANSFGGGFGSSSLGQSLPQFPSQPMNNPSNNFMMDRQQRKDMITKGYLKILGRKPKQNELNYFLNQGISEVDLVKKMAESQEHLEILKAKLELKEKNEELAKLTKQNTGMKAMIREQKALVDNLNRLIAHKNQAISESSMSPGEILLSSQKSEIVAPVLEEVKIDRNIAERIFGFIIRRFG